MVINLKKTICFALIFLSIFLVSCNNSLTLSESIPTVAMSIATVGTNDVIPTLPSTTMATEKTNKEETTHISTQASTVINQTEENLKIIGEYKTLKTFIFENFFKCSINDKNKIDAKKEEDFLIFQICGYTGYQFQTKGNFAISYCRYYVYKDSQKNGMVYTVDLEGTHENPYYGNFRYEIGDKYIALSAKGYNNYLNSKDDKGYLELLTCNCKIEEIDGVEWVYPNYMTDLSFLKCAVRITDEYENLFYKPGKDDDIIEYLEENNIPNPTFDYKCELNAFLKEITNTRVVDTTNISPVGEYASIIDEIEFDGFVEYPIDIRLDDNHPYLPKKELDVTYFNSTIEENSIIIVTILGYTGEEYIENGMVYSNYYVYIEPYKNGKSQCNDDTVYIMKTFGSPSHLYYGQRRMEIGDRYLRLETDKSFIQDNGVLSATKLFFIIDDEENNLQFVVPDFATDFSCVKKGVVSSFEITHEEKQIYIKDRDDSIIDYLTRNGISLPEYSCKAWMSFFIKEINKNMETT